MPLTVNGMTDTDMTNLSTAETIMRGLMNLWEDRSEGPYCMPFGDTVDSQCPIFPREIKREILVRVEAERPLQVNCKDHIK